MVAISTVEAEYVALSKACVMILHFRHLIKTINEECDTTIIFEDNSGAVALSRSSKITSRTKHIDVKFQHVRSLVADDVVVDVQHIETDLEKADILTRSLGASKFLRYRLLLLGV